MAHEDQYKRYRLNDNQRNNIALKLYAGMRAVYGAQLRVEATARGYKDQSVTVSDLGVLRRLSGAAMAIAISSQKAYNYQLQHMLEREQDADEDRIQTLLAIYFGLVITKVNTITVPFAARTAENMAVTDFYHFNGFVTENRDDLLWEVKGPNPAAEPVCQALLDMGQVTWAEIKDEQWPQHPNCLHYPAPVSPTGGPVAGQLWMGTQR